MEHTGTKLRLLTLAVSVALAGTSYADDDVTGVTEAELETITVTGTRTARDLMTSPLSSAVITADEIARSSGDSLADMLRDVPGVQVVDAATPGMKRISIRGESSLRVAILVDGQELTDHSTYGAPLLLDPMMVERIEVIRGTSSVLYGGKALGGVVNFITKKGGEEPLQLAASASYDSATKGNQYFLSAYGAANGFEYRLAYADNEHENRETPDGTLDETEFANDSLMAYLAYSVGNHKFTLNNEQYNLESEIATGTPGFDLNMPQRDRSKTSLAYDGKDFGNVLVKAHLDAYTQTIDRLFTQHMEMSGIPLAPPAPFPTMDMVLDTAIDETLDTQGFNGQLDFRLNDNHYLIAGVQYTKDEVEKKTDTDRVTTVRVPGAPAVPRPSSTSSVENAELTTKALYLQDEWQASEQLLVTAGVRHYWVDADLLNSNREGFNPSSNDDTKFIGSIAANYAVNDNHNLRAAFSQGYHYPTLLQVATGATAAGTFINPNANLSPETSDNFEVGYRMRQDGWVLDATLFYTDASDYITTMDCSAVELACLTPEDDVYVNANKATSHGLEFNAAYEANGIRPYLEMTYSEREQDFDGFVTKDTGLPKLYGRAGVNVTGELSWLDDYFVDAYVRGASSATEAFKDGSSTEHGGWGTVNLGFGSYFGADNNWLVSVEGSNLFDKRYTPARESLMAAGRGIMVKFSAEF